MGHVFSKSRLSQRTRDEGQKHDEIEQARRDPGIEETGVGWRRIARCRTFAGRAPRRASNSGRTSLGPRTRHPTAMLASSISS